LISYQLTIKQLKLKEFRFNNIGMQMAIIWYLITVKFTSYIQFSQQKILFTQLKKAFLIS